MRAASDPSHSDRDREFERDSASSAQREAEGSLGRTDKLTKRGAARARRAYHELNAQAHASKLKPA
jgi:hypothetical protein